MKGFFDRRGLATPYKSEKGVLSCVSCGLYKTAMSPKMKPYGEFKKQIMVIGEAPSEEADRKGKPLQGRMGQLVQRKFKQLGIDLFEDCVSIYTVNCRPTNKDGNNRTPTDHEIACCRQKVISAIKEYKPKVIILQGGSAVSSLITGYRWRGEKQVGITTWRGWTIPDREFNAWLCPTFHPSYIERQEEENEVNVIWTQDLKRAIAKLDEPFPIFKDEKKCVVITYDTNDLLYSILKEKPPLMSFDIETTGLKPYNREDHRIVAISFCYNENQAFATPFPEDTKGLKLLKRLLQHPDIGKIAANMKYEDNWLCFLHGIETNPWAFDTMQATHVLDNRPKICGLKFQVYIHYGLSGYDEGAGPFLKSSEPNKPNRIMEMVRDKLLFKELLLYNGLDSLFEFRLALKQMKEMGW